jgi:hypothetical protein
MKKLIAAVFVAGIASAGFSVSSHAIPVAPVKPEASAVIPVAGGCGPGWHRGPYGGCRPMYNCPPGWHSGPFGRHCFRN